MDTATATITREQAEQTLAAVRARFIDYLTEHHYPATEAVKINGVDYPASKALTLAPACPEPTLSDQWNDGWAIVWEEGPDEWTYRVHGGTSEEERGLAAEFGQTLPEEAGATIPAGVYVEPYNHIVLSIYPA